jgi:hypothetical protein
MRANKACSRLVGFCAVFEHFSGFGLFLLPSRIPARPPAANANRWAASAILKIALYKKEISHANCNQ